MTIAIAILLGLAAAWAIIGHVAQFRMAADSEQTLTAAIIALGFLGLLLK